MSKEFPHIPIDKANEELMKYTRMYNYLHRNDNRMLLSEFRKYETLYKAHTEEEFYDTTVEKNYHNLSMEFLQKINPYKPFVVIDDITEEEYVFPAIYQPIAPIRPEHSEASHNFNNYGLITDRPDYIYKYKNEFLHALFSNQDLSKETLVNNRLNTENIANTLMSKVSGKLENTDIGDSIEPETELVEEEIDTDNTVSVSWSFDE